MKTSVNFFLTDFISLYQLNLLYSSFSQVFKMRTERNPTLMEQKWKRPVSEA